MKDHISLYYVLAICPKSVLHDRVYMFYLLRQKLLTYSRYISEKPFSIISAMNMPKWCLSQHLGVCLWKLVVHPITVYGLGPCIPDGDGLLNHSNDPVSSFMGSLTLPQSMVWLVCSTSSTSADGCISVKESFFLDLVNLNFSNEFTSILYSLSQLLNLLSVSHM